MNLLSTVFAQTIDIAPQGSVATGIEGYTVSGLISFAISMILIVAGIIFFFMLVMGGIQWITSGGDKANTEGARNRITAALIGLIIVFSAWAIITLMGELFGFSLLELELPTLGGGVNSDTGE